MATDPRRDGFAQSFSETLSHVCRVGSVSQKDLAAKIARDELDRRGFGRLPDEQAAFRQAQGRWERRISAWKTGDRIPQSEDELLLAMGHIAPGTSRADWVRLWRHGPGSLAARPDAQPGRSRIRQTTGVAPRAVEFMIPRLELDTLSDCWSSRTAGPLISVLTGHPGVGKTQIAGAYMRRMALERGLSVSWLNADSPDSLRRDALMACRVFGLYPNENLSNSEIFLALRQVWEQSNQPSLVVLDDVRDPRPISYLLPEVGDIHVVITTLDTSFSAIGFPICVAEFSDDQAESYLRSRLGNVDSDAAKMLTHELGALPLALAQACTVIDSQRLSIESYVERLAQFPVSRSLARRNADAYPRGAFEAISLTLTQLCASGPDVLLQSLLAVLGFGVDLAVSELVNWQAAAGNSEVDVREALALLSGSSILEFSEDGMNVQVNTLVAHVISESLFESNPKIERMQASVGETVLLPGCVLMGWKSPSNRGLIYSADEWALWVEGVKSEELRRTSGFDISEKASNRGERGKR